MKTYIKPTTYCTTLQLGNIIAVSVGGGVNNESLGNGSGDLGSREKHSGGFGSGMWEDMK
ncbi:MAG: hypothetical protein IJ659_05945 [Alloprevotella sp.]|nr:hypothetical protein [Alloprevotella sp.]